MKNLSNRLTRYRDFMDHRFVEGLRRNKDYSLSLMRDDLRQKIKSGHFKTIIFTGMGCSAIVSDLIRGFFLAESVPIDVLVINDYDFGHDIPAGLVEDDATLLIVSSYSGHSAEPVRAYERFREVNANIIFLTSGGLLKEIGVQDGISIILWELDRPDREYPLLHVPQYFSILLDVFHEFGILSSNYQDQLNKTATELAQGFRDRKLDRARRIAEMLLEGETVVLATPKWHSSLLKIVRMHLNEIAMIPAHQNRFHEFCHSEVAVFGERGERRNVLIFRDQDEDDYTVKKMDNLVRLLTDSSNGSNLIKVANLDIVGPTYIDQLFSSLLFVSYVTYFVGAHHNRPSRDLISRAAGNLWYSSEAIQQELGAEREKYDVAV